MAMYRNRAYEGRARPSKQQKEYEIDIRKNVGRFWIEIPDRPNPKASTTDESSPPRRTQQSGLRENAKMSAA